MSSRVLPSDYLVEAACFFGYSYADGEELPGATQSAFFPKAWSVRSERLGIGRSSAFAIAGGSVFLRVLIGVAASLRPGP